MNLVLMLVQLLQNLVLKSPLKEIQLTHRGVQPLEMNVLPAAKGVKHPLGLRLEMRLLGKIHDHLSSGRGRL